MVTTYPKSTSWGAALGGWLAAIGLLAILHQVGQPLAVALAPGLPIVITYLVLMAIAYLVGGYIAGRAGGWRTGWHGLLAGIVSLAVMLMLTLASMSMSPVAMSLANVYSGDSVRFWVPEYGAYPLGFVALLVMVLAAWMGGILAPTRAVTAVGATQVVTPTERRVVEERRTVYRPGAVGAKGGEVHEEDTGKPPKS